MRKTLYPGLAILAATLFTGCAHRPQIANFGFFSYDAQKERQVACLESEAMGGMECESLVRAGIAQVNATLGYRHYVYIGIIGQSEAQAQFDRGTWIASGSSKLAGTPKLGVTMPQMTPDHLLSNVIIALNPDLLDKFKDYSVAVVVHELIHAMGVMHAECDGPFKSIMAPAVVCPSGSPAISAGDAETLRQAYPKR